MKEITLRGGPRCGRPWLSIVGSAVLTLGLVLPAAAACDPDGLQASGAVYRICMPDAGSWNGRLVVWAHGYVAFNEPVAIPENQLRLPDGTLLPDLVNQLGFAFATTSYSTNGTAIRQGLADVSDLVEIFKDQKGPVAQVYVTGASEGGLIAALATEQYPDVFAGGLAACGPLGSFPGQVGYFGDFRVTFDYYYPSLLPGDPTHIPPALIDNWDAYYEGVVAPVVFAPANLDRTRQFLKAALVPVDPASFWPTAEHSIRDGLWYSVFGTGDAVAKLGGQPFDNTRRLYFGTDDDFLLNTLVRRLSADPAAVAEMRAHYDTTGRLLRPLVTLHTRLDQQVPAWHQAAYTWKVLAAGSAQNLIPILVSRYGHCNFTSAEVLVSFALMVLKAEGYFDTARLERALRIPRTQAEFRKLARKHGLRRGSIR